jgi:four helix bundle protein
LEIECENKGVKMGSGMEDLEILRDAEQVADEIWELTKAWERTARDVVGLQMARAADSIGANIAEAFGRYHYFDKIRFLYYARGSLFETRFWINRAASRALLPQEGARRFHTRLVQLGRRLNAFVRKLRAQASSLKTQSRIANH